MPKSCPKTQERIFFLAFFTVKLLILFRSFGMIRKNTLQKEGLGMTQDLLQLISNEMKGFSKGQKRIGAFILEHYDKAAFMTAA